MMSTSAYISRCQKELKEWKAPLSDWYPTDLIDIEDENSSNGLFTCELCGCSRVRFVHVMEHDLYFESVSVGCICAGIMEGDILAAKERERLMKNRARRKRNFPKRKWKETPNGDYILMYKSSYIQMICSNFNDKHYGVSYKGKTVWKHKGRPITSFLAGVYAAFDLVDPIEKVMNP